MQEIKTKICNKCKVELPASNEYFYTDKRNKSGLRGICNHCSNEMTNKHYKENREWYNQYRKKNKEKIKNTRLEYYEKNKHILLKNRKKYYQENREKAKKYSREKSRNHTDILSDTYIRQMLGVLNPTSEMIETKRLTLQLKRAIGCEITITKTRTRTNEKPDNVQCSACGKEKKYNYDNFYKLSNSKYGLRNICKSCCSEQSRIRHKLKTTKN